MPKTPSHRTGNWPLDGERLLLIWFLTLVMNASAIMIADGDFASYAFFGSLTFGAAAVVIWTAGSPLRRLLFAALYIFLAAVPSWMIIASIACGRYGECL